MLISPNIVCLLPTHVTINFKNNICFFFYHDTMALPILLSAMTIRHFHGLVMHNRHYT